MQLFVANLLIYGVFLAALTYFVLNFPNWEHTDNISGNYSSGYYYNSYYYKFDVSENFTRFNYISVITYSENSFHKSKSNTMYANSFS
jgi:hypothetical protein